MKQQKINLLKQKNNYKQIEEEEEIPTRDRPTKNI